MMKDEEYKLIVDAARLAGAKFPSNAHWLAFKAAIDRAVAMFAGLDPASTGNFMSGAIPPPAPKPLERVAGHRRISAKGTALIHRFETCKLTTYKDPGSKNGLPITGGWGSTVDENGQPFKLGVTKSREYWDRLFDVQIRGYERAVDELTKDVPTNQNEFDAMTSLCYNIGIGSRNRKLKGGFTRSSVLRLHRAGDKEGAAKAFLLWNKNDGQVMKGLTRRRLAESDLYDDPV